MLLREALGLRARHLLPAQPEDMKKCGHRSRLINDALFRQRVDLSTGRTLVHRSRTLFVQPRESWADGLCVANVDKDGEELHSIGEK